MVQFIVECMHLSDTILTMRSCMPISIQSWPVASSLLLATVLCGCNGAQDSAAEYGPTGTPSTDIPPADPNADDDGSSEEPDLPPEQEDAFFRAVPAASDRYVFVVNPEQDTLSKINAATRAVYTLPVGLHPTQVLTGALNTGLAVVLNEGEATLSLLDVAQDTLQTVPIHPDTNFMALSADGKYAITWFEAQVEGADTSVDGVRSYSNISVVFTGDAQQAPTSTPLAVALNPRGAVFVPAVNQALVLCDGVLAQVYLSAAPTVRLIPLTDDIDEKLSVAEMKVSPDGRFAFLRLSSSAELMVVALQAESAASAVSRIALSAPATDMDLASNQLILVDRAEQQLLIFDVQDPEAAPRSQPTPSNQLVGSLVISPSLNRAILYTTLTEQDLDGTPQEGMPLDRFSLWDLSTDQIKLYDLVKPVESVSMVESSVGDVVTFIHQGKAKSELPSFNQEDALSHFYVSDGQVLPAVLEAPLKAQASVPGGQYGYAILEDGSNVLVVDYSSRQIRSLTLQSRPVFVGVLTGSVEGYVSQEHELGRISFVNPATLQATTITGFELNTQP